MNTPRHDPWDISCEHALLGACLSSDKHMDVAAGEITAADFYDPYHSRIFSKMLYLRGVGAVTVRTLAAGLKSDPAWAEMEEDGYLLALLSQTPSNPPVKDYARILKDLSARRALVDIGKGLIEDAYLPPDEVPTQRLTDEATGALLALGSSYAADRTLALSTVTAGRLQAAERRLAGEHVPRITTGLTRLDKAIGGLQPSDHLVIAGRSGMGKTALLCMFGRAAAMAGSPVMAISADMTKERWGERTLCDVDHLTRSGSLPVRYGHFRGKLGQEQIGHLAIAQQEIATWNYDICDEGQITVERIRAKVRAMANRCPGKQGVLLVDFLQKIATGDSRRDRRRDEDITEVTYAIGDIAKDVGWSAVSLAQMKNKGTDAKGKLLEEPPNESDIRESGGILMAADMVLAPFRKAFFVERREPPGRDFSPEPPVDWQDWNTELQACKDEMQFIGFKNRDDSISKLNMTVWCDMGSNAIRDFRPSPRVDESSDHPF